MKRIMPERTSAACDPDHKNEKKLGTRAFAGSKKEGPVKPARVLREGRKSSDETNNALSDASTM